MAYSVFRGFGAGCAAVAAAMLATPAPANFFWKAPDLRGAPVTGAEPGMVGNLPGATPAELRAALVWNLRSALNVAALQCQFDPTLLTLNQYNHLIDHHKKELGAAFQTLSDYFKRNDKKGWQGKVDSYGTRTYSGFSTVGAQLTFCETSGSIGRDALFTPKGQLYMLAEARMKELRNSLVLSGEQQFRFWIPPYRAVLPNLDDKCWSKDELKARCRV